ELPRTHGLREGLWLMQYQYSQDGQINQGGARQISITTRNWRMLLEVSPGDSCVAYISSRVGNSGPKFYAIGTVSKPKQRTAHRSGAIHHDTIERTTREQT